MNGRESFNLLNVPSLFIPLEILSTYLPRLRNLYVPLPYGINEISVYLFIQALFR